ncbi:MAG: crotonase/enoyl-CoA hydratase family protein [Halieaceae bacterium]|nr:crotonase/enoyl-CoA hydratase family protein [Halieaceae bacterium]
MEFTIQDKVAIITMDDGKANVVSPDFIVTMNDCLDKAEAEGAGAVLLMGREGMFSAGFDLKVFQQGAEAGMAMVAGGMELSIRLFSFPMPVVAACTGHGIAMGAFLLMSCDTRIGTEGDFKLTLPETRIHMDLPKPMVTLSRARLAVAHLSRAAIQSEIYDPIQAVAAGFLDEVTSADRIQARALAVASELAELPQQNYATNKLLVRQPVLDVMKAELVEFKSSVNFG